MTVFDPIDLPLSITTQEDKEDTVECKFKNMQRSKQLQTPVKNMSAKEEKINTKNDSK